MIRHHHAVVPDLLVNPHRLQHIDVPIVYEGFAKVQEAAADVPEMDVEDLASGSEVADDVENLLAGLVEHLRHGPLAEVQSVIRIVGNRDEALETVHRPEHCFNAPPAAPR